MTAEDEFEWFTCLYTHQKTKKAKTWQDGFLKANQSRSICTLFNTCNSTLDKVTLKRSCRVAVGDELEFPRHLVQVEGLSTQQSLKESQQQAIEEQKQLEAENDPPVSKTRAFAVPFKRPASIATPNSTVKKAQLNDLELLNLLSTQPNAPIIDVEECEYALKFAEGSLEIRQERKVSIPIVFSSWKQYTAAMAKALHELIQLNLNKHAASKPAFLHVSCIKESAYNVYTWENCLFFPKKCIITLVDVNLKKLDFAKDDCWVVKGKNGACFVGISSFHGPNSAGELELKVFCTGSASPSSLQPPFSATKVHELSGTEVMLFCMLVGGQLNTFQTVGKFLLSHNAISRVEPLVKIPFKLLEQPSMKFPAFSQLLSQFTLRYGLNSNQQTILSAFAWSLIDPKAFSPFTLVHGVFGAGKSFLVAVAVIFVHDFWALLNSASKLPAPKILIASLSNTAVDRVLSSLLRLNFSSFMRVGSLKKIAKPILPFSMQSAKREEELKELQQMQQQCTPNEAPFIQEAITACKKRENLRVLQEATVIGATCNATTFEVFEGLQFPIVFLDECSQQIEPLSLLPLRLGCKRAVLVGDPMQLPPTIAFNCTKSLAESNSNSLDTTLFRRLAIAGYPVFKLFIQYRCHPQISNIASNLFYQGEIECKYSLEEERIEFQPCLFVNVPEGKAQRSEGGSLYNTQEIEAIVQWLTIHSTKINELNLSIGVISFYKSQIARLSKILAPFGTNIQAATVDSFQGAEKDIILLSIVKTNGNVQNGGEQFVECAKRVNVALTRARHSLVVFGAGDFVERSVLWKKIVHFIEGETRLIEVKESADKGKEIESEENESRDPEDKDGEQHEESDKAIEEDPTDTVN